MEWGKAQVTEVLGHQRVAASRRAVAQPRCVGEARRVLGVERVLRAGGSGGREPFWDGEMGVRAVLRTGLREGSGGDARVALGYVQKGVPSRANGRVPESSGKGAGNLTEHLTAGLTSCLTWYLTTVLTE